ncbi:MAG: hypothetical protein ACRC2J_19750 [Microcoleaceae cyanobacterium]
MAEPEQVRKYLAYWFQLGKRVAVKNGESFLCPQPVITGSHYSQAFEECWQIITASESGDCYLEGTTETIQELLSPQWEIDPCARCEMPVALRIQNIYPVCCPCADLPSWPDMEKPRPRSPVDSQCHLSGICERLKMIQIENLPPRQSKPKLDNDIKFKAS